jgi:hypothetical protein
MSYYAIWEKIGIEVINVCSEKGEEETRKWSRDYGSE